MKSSARRNNMSKFDEFDEFDDLKKFCKVEMLHESCLCNVVLSKFQIVFRFYMISNIRNICNLIEAI